jgi:hypothetical protein
MASHGDDEIMHQTVRAVIEGIEKFGKELELCPQCYYMTLIANLLFPLYKSGAMDEDELMTELQSMVSSFRSIVNEQEPESRVLH